MKELVIKRVGGFNFDAPFVNDLPGGEEYTYQSFFSRVLGIIDSLNEKEAPSHIVCIMDNSVELMAYYFAVVLSGRVAVAIDPVKGSEEIDGILSSINKKYIVVDETTSKKLGGYDRIVPSHSFKNMPFVDIDVKDTILDLLRKRNFLDDCLLTFTSGTSGNTKGVRNSLFNLCSTAEAFNSCFNVGKENAFVHLMPMTYMAGILNTIVQPFIAGSKIIIMGRFSPMVAFSFWQNVATSGVNTLWMSPSMLNIILKVGNEKVGAEYCKNNNMLFFIGTAPLQQKTREQFEERYGVTLYASYGLSETLFLSTETKETVLTGRDNVGKILEGVKYRFSEQGEFLVDVPWMFLGYTNENTEDYFNGSYYKTGDLAEIDNNILQITGRCKDLIIKGGMNISAALIEKTVSQLEGVEECAAFGAVNEFQEESVVLAYVSNESDIEKAITAIIIEKLGRNYLIDSFYKVNAIPKNINGKIDKNTLKEQFKSKK